jgi:hypothetical protein
MFVVAQSDEPVRFLAGSPDPRSHKKIIPTRITKNLRPRRAADGVAWLAPVAASDSYRGQSATVRAGLRQADRTVAALRDTGDNADDIPWS